MKKEQVTHQEEQPKTKTTTDICKELLKDNQFDYGNVINKESLLAMFGVYLTTEEDIKDLPFELMREKFKEDDLKVLTIYGVISRILLSEGKFIEQQKDNYRVCLPSENLDRADRLQKSAQRKISKSRKLLQHTPKKYLGDTNEISSKLLLMEQRSKKFH